MKYAVTIAERTVEVEIDGVNVLVNGVPHHAELRSVAGTPVMNLLLDGQSWIIPMESTGRGTWAVQRRGDRFEVEVVDERTRYIRSLVGESRANAGPAAQKAPMPGLVVKVQVEVGQAVSTGQPVLVLEAMKMENELKAAGPGVVEQIHVKPGQAVEKGAVLVTFLPSQDPRS